MASTYSPSLRLQLMQTGENAGSWGEITNTNLGTALEQAIVGTADITFVGSNITLELTDVNTEQPARALRLNLVGTSGGARILYVPDTEKSYIVRNTLADQVTVTVVSTPGTSVVVPAGKTMYLYVDSVNVTEAINHINNFTTTTPIAVSSGGTGQSSFTNGALLTGTGDAGIGTLVGTVVGQIPQWNGTNWSVASISAGVLTFSAGTTGLTPATASGGAVTLGGTLGVTNGGTGFNTYVAGDLLYATGPGGLQRLAIGTPGQVLTVAGGIPSWSSSSAGITAITAGTGITTSGTTNVTVGVDSSVVATLSGTQTFTGDKSFGTNSSIDYSSGDNFIVRGSGILWIRTVNDPVTTGSSGIRCQAYNLTSTGYSIYYANTSVNVAAANTVVGRGFTSASVNYWTLHDSVLGGIAYDYATAGLYNVGIGFAAGTYWQMFQAGFIVSSVADVRKPGGGSFNNTSDAQLKENVVDYTKGLAELKQLRPVDYNYNDVTDLGKFTNHKTFTGLIAQEVQNTAFADTVNVGSDGYLNLDPSELTFALINAVKELSAQVDALKAEVAALKGI